MARKRFITSVLTTAAKTTTPMPWARGDKRTASVSIRKTPVLRRKSA